MSGLRFYDAFHCFGTLAVVTIITGEELSGRDLGYDICDYKQ